MTRPASLALYAGPEALRRIREEGLAPSSVSHLGAAAGGPKWLVLDRLDRALFGQWFREQRRTIVAVGASIGAWRLCCAAQSDPVAAIQRFEDAYLHQRYGPKATAEDVGVEARRIMDALLGPRGAAEVPAHPWLRVNIVAARGRLGIGHRSRAIENLGLGGALLSNLVSRRLLAGFVERVVLHAPGAPVRLRADGFRTHYAELTPANLPAALMATAAIPAVIPPVRDLPGGPPGGYVDGGMVDYHMDLPLAEPEGLLLLPHFDHRVKTGWLDKFVPWRKPRELARTVVLAPSPEWIARLHGARIPDRKDFQRYDDDTRERHWQQAVSAGQELADEFLELAARERFAAVARPLPA